MYMLAEVRLLKFKNKLILNVHKFKEMPLLIMDVHSIVVHTIE